MEADSWFLHWQCLKSWESSGSMAWREFLKISSSCWTLTWAFTGNSVGEFWFQLLCHFSLSITPLLLNKSNMRVEITHRLQFVSWIITFFCQAQDTFDNLNSPVSDGGYILLAVAVAQVPFWAFYEIIRCPKDSIVKVSFDFFDSFTFLNFRCFCRNSRECSNQMTNGVQRAPELKTSGWRSMYKEK